MSFLQTRRSFLPHFAPGVALFAALLSGAGCSSGSGSSTATLIPPSGQYSNVQRGVTLDCAKVSPIQLASPSGQTYGCSSLVIGFQASASTPNQGTYTVYATARDVGSVAPLETGTYTLQGSLLTCTTTSSGKTVTATGILTDYTAAPTFPGYVGSLKIQFTGGLQRGQSVTYYNLHNPV